MIKRIATSLALTAGTAVLETADRLTAEEKERRKKNGLCMYCGNKNHFADKCDKNPHNNSKGRLAEVSEESDSESEATPSAPSEVTEK